MFSNFEEEARKILTDAKKEMMSLNHPYIGSEHLLLSILNSNSSVRYRLNDYNITYESFKDKLIEIVGIGTKKSEYFLYTPLLKRIIENSIIDSRDNNTSVSVDILFNNLLEEDGVALRILISLGANKEDLIDKFKTNIKTEKLLLDELGINLNEKALNNELDPVIGRDNEIRRVIEILSRRCKNNPILIGDAGVGKTAIVEEISRRIVSGEVPLFLRNKKIISLDMASIVAGTKYRGEFEERMKKILKEVENNSDIILFIDEIHTLVNAGGAEGAIDAANIFKPALSRNKIRCIGATTTSEYKEFIESDKALERRFQKVYIEKPSKDVVKDILMNIKSIYEEFHNVIISEEIIDEIIRLSDKYIYDRNEPDKSIDILDEVCARVNLKENKKMIEYKKLNRKLKGIISNKNNSIKNSSFTLARKYKEDENKIMNDLNMLELELYKNNKPKIVTKTDLAYVINTKTKIPVYEILNENKKVFTKIKNELSSNIYGEEKIIDNLVNISKRIKLGFSDNKCYSLIFLGPTGVGKTTLAKLFGRELVGSDNVIKLDMSEYSESYSVSKILGSAPGYVGYNDNKNVLDEIKNKPNSVIILDEIEKAHPSIINLLFQILDEGKIKNAKGEVIRFDNTIIIMTTNIGFNKNSVGFNNTKEDYTTKLLEYFPSSFINRIDNTLVFNKLDEDTIKKLISTKIKNIESKYNVKISKKVENEILKECNYDMFGARKIAKVIKDKVENQIIEKIINNDSNIYINSIIDFSLT